MSKTIDQRVVEMRFDNKDFESNVKTSMSTLDKLKQRLNLTGASKGLENIKAAAKKCDLSPLGNAVQTVQAKFSALEVVGVTALANLTNSAVNAGKRIVSALTIDPVMSGFQEYETQINAIQTILANTSHQGTTLEDVTAALDELNQYADQTIYNFTEMTRNIGTFTAAGVDLDTSVGAIKGIANLAAVSGSNATQASAAMYQLSQALAAGRVTLEDWNSVVKAGMGGKIFQDALKNTAKAMGIAVDETVTFRESLSAVGGKDIWLTSDVLLNTLNQFTGDLTDAELAAMGFTSAQIKNIQEMAATANGAATDVKTLTQLWGTLKETAQSGWTQTWEIIVGDFDQSKVLFTEIYKTVSGVLNSMSESRNNLLEGALGGTSKWDDLVAKINEAGISTEDFEAKLIETAKKSGIAIDDIIEKEGSLANAFRNGKLNVSLIVKTIKSFADSLTGASKSTKVATDNLEKFQEVVNKVIKGDFGNGAERVKALTDAGYDQVAVQKLVNKVWEKNGKTWKDTTITAADLEEVIKGLSESELQSIGYTEEQAKALKELAKQAEETGTPLNDLINSLNKPTGRELLIDSFRNIFGSLYDAIVAVKDAWVNIFPPMQSEQLYAIIEKIHDLTVEFRLTEEDADKLRRTFEGLFAVIDLISTVAGGVFKVAFTILEEVLSRFGYNVLDVTAGLGDMLVGLRDFIKENEYVGKAIDFVADCIINLVNKLKELYDAFMDIPQVQSAIEFVKQKFQELPSIGEWAIEGLKNGIAGGWDGIVELLTNIATSILDTIKKILGIHSPSVEMFALGYGGIMQGLVDGILGGIDYLLDALSQVATKILDFFTGIDWTPVVAVLISAGLVATVKKLIDIAEAVTAPLQGVGDVLSSVSEVISEAAEPIAKTIKNFSKVISAKAFEIRAEAVKTLAEAIAILAGSIFVLTLVPPEKVWSSVGAIAALAIIIGALSAVIGQFGPKETIQFGAVAVALLGLAGSLLLVAVAMKLVSTIDANMIGTAVGAMLILASGMVAVIAMYGRLSAGNSEKTVKELGNVLIKMAASFLILAITLKIIAGIEESDILKGAVVLGGFVGIVTLLTLITKLAGNNIDKLGNTLLKMVASMAILVLVIKLISGLSYEDIIKGGVVILGFVGVIALLTLVTKLGGRASKRLGTTLLAMSASILIMAGVVMLLSNMSVEDLGRGMLALVAFAGIIALLTMIVKLAGKDAPQIATTLLAMVAAIAVLATVAIILSFLDPKALAKGIIAVAAISAIMAGLIAVTKFAGESYKTLIVLAAAIAVLAVAIGALSFIETGKLLGASLAIGIVMGMFALIIAMSKDAKGSLATLIVITTAVAAIGGIIYLLASNTDADAALKAGASIALVLLTMSVAFAVIAGISEVARSAYLALVAITLAVAAIAYIIYLLASTENVDKAIEIATALSVMILAMSAACVLLALAGIAGAGALIGIGVLITAVVALGGLIAAIGALASESSQLEEFLDKGIPIIEKIGTAIGTFFGNIIKGALESISASLPTIGMNLSLFMANLTPFMVGVKGFDEETLNAAGRLVAVILAITAADVINSILNFFGLGGSFDTLGEKLATFGNAIVDFSDIVSGNIDAEAVEAAAKCGMLIAELNKSLPASDGILQKFLGEKDLATWSGQITDFADAIVAFSDTVTGTDGTPKVNEGAVAAATRAGTLIAELNKSLPASDGILQQFLGEKDLTTWSTQITDFADAIVSFSDTVTNKDGSPAVNEGSVRAATNAGTLLAELNNNLPSDDGILQDIIGSKDFSTWSEKIKSFGAAIVEFSDTVTNSDGTPAINDASVLAAINAGSLLSALNNALPESGGILQTFTGEKNLGTFGEQLQTFGFHLWMFASYTDHIKDPQHIVDLIPAVESMIELANSLGNHDWFTDEKTLDEMGTQFSGLGTGLRDYYTAIESIDITRLTNANDQVARLINFGTFLKNVDMDKFGSFGEALGELADTGMSEFVSAFENSSDEAERAVQSLISAFTTAVNNEKPIAKTSFNSIVYEGLEALKSKMPDFTSAGRGVITNFDFGVKGQIPIVKTTFTSLVQQVILSIQTKYTDFRKAGKTVVENFNNGIKTSTNVAKTAFLTILTETVTAIRIRYSAFYSAGSYLVDGLRRGIEDAAEDAIEAVRNMAKEMEKVTKRTLKIRSPSRVFESLGKFIPMGFARGIDKGQSFIEDSAYSMADQAVSVVSNTISSIVDAINSDIDTQPTIRPVLDLSDVQNKAGLLNTLFNSNQAMAISATMNANRQYEDEIQNGGLSGVSGQVVNNNFVQNNYSPKALSRIDIYRQSKNLFSARARRLPSQ